MKYHCRIHSLKSIEFKVPTIVVICLNFNNNKNGISIKLYNRVLIRQNTFYYGLHTTNHT